MENEKQKEIIESSSKKKKFNLVIDYSKFQNNFMNNLKKEENKEKNNQEEKDNKINQTPKSKNYDQFLNVSEILNENLSQSSLNEQENQKNKNEMDNNKIKENKSNKINKSLFNNNILDNFSIGESDEPNLLGYNDLLMTYNNNDNNNKRKKLDKNKKENDYNKTSLNSYRKKRNYVKFLNKNNLELKLSKTIDKEKTSYAKINEKNKLFKEKNYKNKFTNRSDNFNNNSVLTLSDISNVPSTTTTIDFITGNTSKNFSNKSYYNNTVNSNLIMNKNNKNMSNKRLHSKENSYHSVNEIKLNNNNINRKRKKSYEKQNNLMIYVNKKKPSENENKNEKDDLIYLLDNIKTKYKKQENKFINQQNNMKSEIEILREKLKTLSVNEALYQVEIEKLKRKNNNENSNLNDKNEFGHNDNTSEKKFFEKKLDDIIVKHNKENNNNINLYSFSKKPFNSNFEQLLDFFNLDKDLFSGDNIFLENEESFNYEKAFNEYPQIKKFIELLVEKYKKEKEYRTRLEEKTVEIFTNDMKTINILEKKIKKYEENNKHYKINSSLNASLDIGFSDNITKNSFKSCKSCDKMI